MQAVALFLEMVHLALTCLGQRLLCRVDGAQHAIQATASISLDVVLNVEVPLQHFDVLGDFLSPAVASLCGYDLIVWAACQRFTVEGGLDQVLVRSVEHYARGAINQRIVLLADRGELELQSWVAALNVHELTSLADNLLLLVRPKPVKDTLRLLTWHVRALGLFQVCPTKFDRLHI